MNSECYYPVDEILTCHNRKSTGVNNEMKWFQGLGTGTFELSHF